ncbi:MAG: gliding motility-associated ABC transporter substrate-binding protein GldG [Paludibacteraceae bacterium]|nr:gliding motility-associated ABC transporter substrate-binding protein GldG [Paludibacteraceae bacterium]
MKARNIVIVLFVVGLLNLLAYLFVIRVDMTDDKHYSLSEASIELLRKTEASIDITLFLQGDLNAGFERLQRATKETIEEMSVHSDIHFSIEDLQSSYSKEEAERMGMRPIVIHEREQDGKTAQTTIYPYALIQYNGKKAVVALLKNTRGLSGEENLNASIEQIEFAFMEALSLLLQTETPRIAIIEGHGEPDETHTYDLMTALSRYFQVDRGQISGIDSIVDVHILDDYRAILILAPQTPFSDQERFIIDQYLMRGGSILWAIDGIRLSEEVLQQEGFTPIIPLDLGLSEMFFRYGIRINPALVQDIQCLPIPVNVSSDPEQPNLQPMPWTYAPLLLTSQGSPITRNMGQVMSTFVSPIEAVGGEDGIEKRVLLATSTASCLTATPGKVDLNDMNPNIEQFKYQYIPIAVSLEGVFPSAYAHRMMPDGIASDEKIRKQSTPTRQIVIASGSIVINETQKGQILPMGYDRYSGMQFSNRDMIVNCLLWLTDSEGLINLREKDITLRLLNDKRAHDERLTVQLISTISPIAILALVGGVVMIIRKRKYQKR